MADFDVKIKGLDEMVAKFKKAPEIAEPIFQKAILASQAALAKYTLKKNPVPWQTGNLLMSFRYQTGRLFARWYPTAFYAVYVHEGTGPRVIEAKNAKVLANPKTGQIFGKRVNHPGTRPQRYMPVIADNAQADINNLFKEANDIFLEALAK